MSDVTLAIVAYNAEKQIVDLFESIKQQTVEPEEVLVVVDFPEDTTIPVANKYGAKVIVNPKGKMYEGRNTALENCKTKYLAFTDSDCMLDEHFIENFLKVFQEHPEVVAGTGRHPRISKERNIWSWLHHMRFVVEAQKTGYVNGVIGANSYFRVDKLKEVGGWAKVKLMAAEDVNISRKLTKEGYKIWYDEGVIVNHKYKSDFKSLVKQEIVMGHDIAAMLKTEKDFGWLWYYTLIIPVMAMGVFFSLGVYFLASKASGLILLLAIFGGSLAFLTLQYKSFTKALPRWIARWALIWPYSIGVIKGLAYKVKNDK